jgi:hypothetical protein
MALIEIANEDRVITITPTGAATWTPGNPTYTEHPSNKVKCNNRGVLLSRISWTLAVAACTKVGYNHNGGGTLNPIDPSGTKVNETNLPVWMGKPLRKNDKGNCMGIFVKAIFPWDVVNCTCDFEITDAGQVKAKCQ